ncbi:MAG TPA: FHA domain-containing protein, partial [Anaerolineales bacterium]|nr:FHA domain-containing protein [Anaerolineales bacterium]
RKFLSLLLGLGLLLSVVPVVQAQQPSATVTLYNADATAFPAVSAFVDVFDAQRIFASGLKPEAVSVTENGQPLPADSLIEMAIPLQMVVAVNQGPGLDARNATGISRFSRVSQVIAQWAQSRAPDLPDDLSLVSQAGPVINHASAADFVVGLNGFQPDMRTAAPNLQSLATALDVVGAQTQRLGMKRAVLFITPQMQDANLAALVEPLMQRAVEGNVRIFVWYVDANTTFTNTSAAIFNNLAIQTGGSMFQYSGEERFPDPEVYFSALRRIYLLNYTSRVTVPGEQSIIVQVNLPSGAVTSTEQHFNLNIQPPNPFPVAPALQVTRQAPADDPFNTELLLPETQEIEIIIEFPDGHPRKLTRTTLYVDGAAVDENTTEPFNKFTWDLKAYTSSNEHQIVVEAVDELGLSKTSMPVPITVTVIKPPSGPAAFLAKYRTPITFGSIILAGLVLFFILISGRFNLPALRRVREERRARHDPLTQPVQPRDDTPVSMPVAKKTRKPLIQFRKTETTPRSVVDAPAALIRINADGQFIASQPIPMNGKEIVLGTDPTQCTMILDDPSISSVHARIRVTDDGGYLIQDNNSIGGTWINYEPVKRDGYRLMHGDMVNFGQLAYRFMLKTPPPVSPPKITLQNADE